MRKIRFEDWMLTFTESIATFDYFTDFMKVKNNVKKFEKQINELNKLIHSNSPESKIADAINQNPKLLSVIPALIAKRDLKIKINNNGKEIIYDFGSLKNKMHEYIEFLKQTKLLDVLTNNITNLNDYLFGIEVGLDSNARKNRTGAAMEKLVEQHIQSLGFIKNKNYWCQLSATKINSMFNIDVTKIDQKDKAEKRFDFVIFYKNNIFAIECNFYSGGGSKLNETARSYKNIALESKNVKNFTFVWITDGAGWLNTKPPLKEAWETFDTIYNLNDLKNNLLSNFIKRRN